MSSAISKRTGKVLLIPHGGGPMPAMGDPNHKELIHWLKTFPKSVMPKPSAIVVFSAHWEETAPTITSGPNPSLIYDYYGFPPETYKLQYAAPGSPKIAKKIFDLFTGAGIKSQLDDTRGWDHGVFIPLLLMYPDADIPVVQVSLAKGLDPDLHIRMGRALIPLLEEAGDNVLLLGSGFTFHNMQAFFGSEKDRKEPNEAFEAWLKETCAGGSLTDTERAERLVNWARAPGARYCHPREEHLIPLHVCYGAGGGGAGQQVFDGTVMARTSGYMW